MLNTEVSQNKTKTPHKTMPVSQMNNSMKDLVLGPHRDLVLIAFVALLLACWKV